MNFKKLDKRMNGHLWYKYGVDFTGRETKLFIEQRLWLWEIYGPSVELENVHLMQPTPVWAWGWDQYNTRLFFATDKEANWWKLKWLTA